MPEIYPEFTILIILTSVLLAILQYFNTNHKECIFDLRNHLKESKLPIQNEGMKRVRVILDDLLNIETIGLGRLIQGVYCGLATQIASFCVFLWLENISVFDLITSILSIYILGLYLWGGRKLYQMKKQQDSIKSLKKQFEDSYDLVIQTMFGNDYDDDSPITTSSSKPT